MQCSLRDSCDCRPISLCLVATIGLKAAIVNLFIIHYFMLIFLVSVLTDNSKLSKNVWRKAASPCCPLAAANGFVTLTPSNTWFLGSGPPESLPHTASRSVQRFLQNLRTWPTDRPTVCQSTRHTVNSAYSKLVTGNSPQADIYAIKLTWHFSRNIGWL